MRKDIAELWNLIEPYAQGAGFDLVELEYGREAGGLVLRVYIDRPAPPQVAGGDGAEGTAIESTVAGLQGGVGHEDCERVSRDVSAALDVANVVPHAYRLEVSSPGIARPLRREQDFKRFAGHQAKIRTADPVEGRRNFSGTIKGVHDGIVDVECDGRSYEVPIDGVVRANLVPDWTAEFKKADRSAS
jgi:ribosome maturation factor RimP